MGKVYDVAELMKIISSNSLVSGVSISGGEPTLQTDLFELCKEIHQLGRYLSIDTNGSHSEIIQDLLPFVNRIALDLKGPLKIAKLKKITGINVEIDEIIRTIEILKEHPEIDFEIRTTYVKNLLTPEDLKDILFFLKEKQFSGIFVLQQYQFFEGVGEQFKEIFQKPDHEALLDLLSTYKDSEFLFKIFLRDDIVGYKSIDELF